MYRVPRSGPPNAAEVTWRAGRRTTRQQGQDQAGTAGQAHRTDRVARVEPGTHARDGVDGVHVAGQDVHPPQQPSIGIPDRALAQLTPGRHGRPRPRGSGSWRAHLQLGRLPSWSSLRAGWAAFCWAAIDLPSSSCPGTQQAGCQALVFGLTSPPPFVRYWFRHRLGRKLSDDFPARAGSVRMGEAGDSPLPRSAREREVATRFATAFTGGDVDGVVALLTDDAWFTMPPATLEYQGPVAIGAFLRSVAAWRGSGRYRLIPTRADGQPAYRFYMADDGASSFCSHGLVVLTLEGDRISAITRFRDIQLTGVAARSRSRSLRQPQHLAVGCRLLRSSEYPLLALSTTGWWGGSGCHRRWNSRVGGAGPDWRCRLAAALAARGGVAALVASRRGTRAVSSAGERFPDTEEVTGSNPVRPTVFSCSFSTKSDNRLSLGSVDWHPLNYALQASPQSVVPTRPNCG
jgi:hypothetical protein